MDCFKLESQTLKYLQDQSNHLNSLSQWLSRIIQIRAQFLPEVPIPYIDSFWVALVTQNQTNEDRKNHLLQVAGAYYRIPDPGQYIVIQFKKLLKSQKSIPLIIKFNEALLAISRDLIQNKDIYQFTQQCNKLREFLTHFQKENFYSLYKWKIQTSLIVCKELLMKEPFGKNQFLSYLKNGRELVKKKQLSYSLQLQAYEKILNYSKNQLQVEKNNKYLNMEFQILYKKLNNRSDNKCLNSTQRKLFKNITNRSQKNQIDQYFEGDQYQKINTQFKKIEKEHDRKKNFKEGLAYFVHRPRQSKSQHRKIYSRTYRPNSTGTHSIGPNISIAKNQSNMVRNRSQNNSPRSGFIINRNLCRKNLTNSINQRRDTFMVKNGKSIKYTKNMYHEILSGEKRVIVLKNDKIIDEIKKIQMRESEKPTPTFNEIVTMGQKNSQNKNQSVFSIKGLASEEVLCLETYDVTFTHIFGPFVGFVNMKSGKISNQHKMTLTYNYWDIINEPIFVNKKPNFSFEGLRKEISGSQFYFELIQNLVQKDINQQELTYVSNFLDGENNKLAFLLIYMGRLCQGYIYWYFTKAMKINGTLMIRRQIPPLSDPLKFAIALDYLRKNDPSLSFEKLSQTRNKNALLQCFQYLFYGRKFIVMDLGIFYRQICFFTLSIQTFSSENFIISDQGSYFDNIDFHLNIYRLKSWQLIWHKKTKLVGILTKKQITTMLLENIIQNKLNTRIIMKVLNGVVIKYISEQKQYFGVQNTRLRATTFTDYCVQEQERTDENKFEEQSSVIINLYRNVYQHTHYISNFITLILRYISIHNLEISCNITCMYKSTIRVNQHFYKKTRVQLECGLSVDMVCYPNKNSEINIDKTDKIRLQCYRKQETPYFDRIVQYSESQKLFIVNKMKYNMMIQKYEGDHLRVIHKQLIKTQFVQNKYLYVSLIYDHSLGFFRLEAYNPKNSNRYFIYLNPNVFHQHQLVHCFQQNIEILTPSLEQIWVLGHTFKLIKTISVFNTLTFEKRRSLLQLVEVNEQIYLLQRKFGEKDIYAHKVEQAILNTNNQINMFSEYKKKNTHSTRLLDLIRGLILQFSASDLSMQPLSRLQDLSLLT